MIKKFSWFSLACHIPVLIPFLFSRLPENYPQWTISFAFTLGILTGIGSLVLIVINAHRKIITDRLTVLVVAATLTLSVVELTWFVWILKSLGDFN